MPFVLRDSTTTDNPPLATVYGYQIGVGKLIYYIKEGRTKCIIALGDSDMDGVNKVYYNGEIIPEFASANPTDRNWKFHPGTITTQPSTFVDVTAVSGVTLTLASNPFGNIGNVKEVVTATGGTRALSFLGKTTSNLAYNANAATIQSALESLSTIGIGNVTVTGSAGTYYYAFSADLAQYATSLTLLLASASGTATLTGGSSTITVPNQVAVVAGVDPVGFSWPTGVLPNQKLYVTYSSGNNIKLALSPGGADISWTDYSSYLVNNMKVYSADGGYFDPIQGRPEFFPTIDYTFSGISYLEIMLPTAMSEIESDAPSKFKIFVRGKRLQNFDASGNYADDKGVAYPDQNNLPTQTKFFSANNALVALDIMLNYMNIDKSRIDFASFVAFRNFCDAKINWNSGTTKILGNPSFTQNHTDNPYVGYVTKNAGTFGYNNWDAGALTVENTTATDDVKMSGIYNGGHGAIGITTATVASTLSYYHSGNIASIHPSAYDGRVRVYIGNTSTPVYNESIPFSVGDTFTIELTNDAINCYQNDTLLYTKNNDATGTLRGFVAFSTQDASYRDVRFYPMTGSTRQVNRFDAHVVFPSQIDCMAALQQIFGRAPGCHWQDVNGKIKFICGSDRKDLTWGESASAGDRVLPLVLSYDPTTSAYFAPTGSLVNLALAGTVTASSTYLAGGYPTSAVNNGNRVTGTSGWGAGEGWQTEAYPSVSSPEWLEIDFKEKKYLNKISLFTIKDSVNYTTVTAGDTFTLYGVVNFDMQYWNGTVWVTVKSVLNNNQVWVDATFPTVSTDKIRIYFTEALAGRARIIELEAWGYEMSVSTVTRSNILADSFSSYKTPPENKSNFMRIELRDLDDTYFTKKYSYVDRSDLREQVGALIDPGIIQIGVATQSLADRIGEASMRLNSDLDLFISVKGDASTYALSVGDIVKIAHDVPNWTLNSVAEFIVIEDTIESGDSSADDKSYLLQSYSPEFYSDNNHGTITATLPVSVSALTPPPQPLSLTLLEETRVLPDGNSYSVIVGNVEFDSSYPFVQRARIYWKKVLATDFVSAGIVLDQPNTSITNIPFELPFATIGVNEVKAETETLAGVLSTGSLIEIIDISGTIEVQEVDWEQQVNTTIIGKRLTKTAGSDGLNASGKSTKAIAFGDGYLQFKYAPTNTGTNSRVVVGLNCYNITDNGDDVIYGLQLEIGALPKYIVNNGTPTAVSIGSVSAVGDFYKIELLGNAVNFYQVMGSTSTLIYTTTNLGKYPLYVDTSIYHLGEGLEPIQVYGNLEQTSGLRTHWINITGVTISSTSDIETLTKSFADGWVDATFAGTFSSEIITKNGSVEWKASSTSGYKMCGLSAVDAPITTAGYLGIDYAFYTEDGAVLSVREKNTGGTSLWAGTYTSSDILRIERVGNTIYYRKNGLVVYTSLVHTTAFLYVDTAFYSNASALVDIRVKKVGNYLAVSYVYPVYLCESLTISTDRPQDDGNVYFELSGVFAIESDNAIQRANVRVFDKFGTCLTGENTPLIYTFTGNGILAQGYHARKYADPFEEAIYEVRVDNGVGLSGTIFVKGVTKSFTMPALSNKLSAVQDLIASAIDHKQIALSWSYGSNVDVQYRMSGSSTWATLVSNTASPTYTATGLSADTYYEFRARPQGTSANYSNIARTKTFQAPLATDTAPPPVGLTATVDSSTQITLNWTRNSTTNTDVKTYKDGTSTTVGSATTITKTYTGLTANTTYTFKIKNVYAGGDSVDSNTVTATTSSGASNNAPYGLYAFALGTASIRLNWTNVVTSANIDVYMSTDGSTWGSPIDTISATISTYNVTGLDPSTLYYFKVKNTGQTGDSNIASEYTQDDVGQCVLWSTWIMTVVNSRIVKTLARDVRQGDNILTVMKGGEIAVTQVKSVMSGFSDTLELITTNRGETIECTPSHPLISNMGLDVIKTVNTSSGSSILVYNDIIDKVCEDVIYSRETIKGNFNVITFELNSDEHTFIANNVVSHNIREK